MAKRSRSRYYAPPEVDGRGVRPFPPLTDAERAFCERNIGLAYHLALRYKTSAPNITADELISEALLALMRAARDFDPSLGYRESTYISRKVWGGLRHGVRDASPMKHRGAEAHAVYERALAQAAAEGRAGDHEHALALTGWTPAQWDAYAGRRALMATSLDSPYAGPDSRPLQPVDPAPTPERALLAAEVEAHCMALVGKLPETQAACVRLVVLDGMTQSDAAAVLGIAQMSVSRAVRRAIPRLRAMAATDPVLAEYAADPPEEDPDAR